MRAELQKVFKLHGYHKSALPIVQIWLPLASIDECITKAEWVCREAEARRLRVDSVRSK